MALKLPRTIRLDPSDEFVFPLAAQPGEWAVSGAFRFWDVDTDALAGKDRQAFRAGLLGIESFGWSTLVVVSDAKEDELKAAIDRLAVQLVDHLGAPSFEAARAAAAEEIAFASSLCDHPVNTLLAVQRSTEPEGIRERFRTLRKRDDITKPTQAFVIVEDETDEIAEHVDLATLSKADLK